MNKKPLCVDCDGTLLRTDLLYESFFGLLKQSFFSLFLLPIWILNGKAYLKEQIAKRVQVDTSLLPYNNELVDYLRHEKNAGRELTLATASHRLYAEAVARHVGLFDRVEATENGKNLSAKHKAERLCELYGEKGFDYAGNDKDDLAVWEKASAGIVILASESIYAKAKRLVPIEAVFEMSKPDILVFMKALRLHQWLKNILIFVPLLAAHKVSDLSLLVDAVKAFAAFGLCASSVYLLNDLIDLPVDRVHPRKRERAFASGAISIKYGLFLIPLLLLLAVAISYFLPLEFIAVLGAYYVTTLAYSFWIKSKLIVDVITLAALYTFRIIAGAAAVQVVPSFWLLAFSMFLFLSLAIVKRYSELLTMLGQSKKKAGGRGYRVDDLPVLMSMGTASGYLAVLVLALYVNSPDVSKLYPTYQLLWLILPPLLFWIGRVWMKTHRGEMHDDPVVFAIKDKVSLYTVVFIGVVGVLAWYLKVF